jgi:hypothetical protein
MSYPDHDKKTSVNTTLVKRTTSLDHCNDDGCLDPVRSAAITLGRDRLGHGPHSFGNHSIRCGAVMAVHLGGGITFAIMITGRWKPAAFMEFIREQVNDSS